MTTNGNRIGLIGSRTGPGQEAVSPFFRYPK